MKYFYSILFIVGLTISLDAQEKKADKGAEPVEEKKIDTVKVNYMPTGVRLGTDVLSIISSQIGSKFSGWEVNADVDFYRYYLAIDYGYWAKQLKVKNGDFENSGNYFRVGADVNFLLKDPDRNMVFLGYRYGLSTFDHSSEFLQNFVDPLSSSDAGVRAHWMELTGGLRVKIWKMIWVGYTARFKFVPRATNYSRMQPYDIPGYGIFEKKIYWGFNYQLFFKIPVRARE
ncbi:MAG: hypothetical protein JJE09_02845 [Bacteroidia bacterium]|nr:hypothetical protein [Bacteroidia bacterium]